MSERKFLFVKGTRREWFATVNTAWRFLNVKGWTVGIKECKSSYHSNNSIVLKCLRHFICGGKDVKMVKKNLWDKVGKIAEKMYQLQDRLSALEYCRGYTARIGQHQPNYGSNTEFLDWLKIILTLKRWQKNFQWKIIRKDNLEILQLTKHIGFYKRNGKHRVTSLKNQREMMRDKRP